MSEKPPHPHPPIVRWLLLPTLLSLAGFLSALAWSCWDHRGLVRLMWLDDGLTGIGFVLGAAMAVATARRLPVRIGLAIHLGAFLLPLGWSAAKALNSTAGSGLWVAFWSLVRDFPGTVGMGLRVAVVLTLLHSRMEREGRRRYWEGAFGHPVGMMLCGTPLALSAAQPAERILGFFAVLGVGQALACSRS